MTSIIDDIRRKLPDVYNKDKDLIKLLNIIAEQITIHNERTEDVRAQLYAESATWSLSRWEDELGLKIAVNDPIEARRSRVMAKLRIRLPYSASMLASIAEAFTNKPVTVTVNAAEYTIQFTFNGAFITDPNFYEQIDNAIQAHMLPLYRSEWEYKSGIKSVGEYSVFNYPFQAFAGQTVYAGTLYNGPAVVNIPPNPVYNNGTLKAANTFDKKLQAAFPITSLVYVGSSGVSIPPTVKPDDQVATYNNGGESISAAYEKQQQRAYKLTGKTNTGTGETI